MSGGVGDESPFQGLCGLRPFFCRRIFERERPRKRRGLRLRVGDLQILTTSSMSLQGAQATAVPQKPGVGWSVLNNRLFRRLWIANVASGVGSAMHDTAGVWTMATLTASPTLVTLMQTMSSLPLFLFGLPAGALADILDRRKLIIAAQISSLL